MAKEQGYGDGIYGPHSSGNLISDGKRTQLYPIDHDPLLYTQAQVDAHVKAESARWAEIADAAYERGRTQERERCAQIAEAFKTGYVGEYHVSAVERDARTQVADLIRSGK